MKINNKIAKYKELNKPPFKKVPSDTAVGNKNGTNNSYKTMALKLLGISNLQKKLKNFLKKVRNTTSPFLKTPLTVCIKVLYLEIILMQTQH